MAQFAHAGRTAQVRSRLAPPTFFDARETRHLLFLGSLFLLANFGAAIWHLWLLIRVQPGTPRAALLGLVLVNLIPVAALLVFRQGRSQLAGAMIVVPLGIAFLAGSYVHFLSRGGDNVLRLPPGPWRVPFQISAALLLLLEALACGVGVRMLRSR